MPSLRLSLPARAAHSARGWDTGTGLQEHHRSRTTLGRDRRDGVQRGQEPGPAGHTDRTQLRGKGSGGARNEHCQRHPWSRGASHGAARKHRGARGGSGRSSRRCGAGAGRGRGGAERAVPARPRPHLERRVETGGFAARRSVAAGPCAGRAPGSARFSSSCCCCSPPPRLGRAPPRGRAADRSRLPVSGAVGARGASLGRRCRRAVRDRASE